MEGVKQIFQHKFGNILCKWGGEQWWQFDFDEGRWIKTDKI